MTFHDHTLTAAHREFGRKNAEQRADDKGDLADVMAALAKRDAEIQTFARKATEEIKATGQMAAETKNALEAITKTGDELRGRLQEVEQRLARRGGGDGTHTKSWGEQVADSPEYKALAASHGGRARISVKTTITSGNTSGGALIAPDRRPTPIMLPKRRVRVRDLLAPGRTSSNSIQYPRQTLRTNAAATVAEGAQKPESALAFELVNAPVQTIAHTMPASKQVLDDAPMLRSLIDSELLYMLDDVEELQLLMGSGSGTNLQGVYTVATAYAAPFTIPNPTMIDVLLLAITQVQVAGYDPDGIVLNPLDWARILTMKDGEERYLANGPFGPEQIARLWTLPVAPTTAMTQDKFLITTRTGAQIFDREDAAVEISTEHADFFTHNMIMLRAEERLGLATYRPASFTKGDFSDAITASTAP